MWIRLISRKQFWLISAGFVVTGIFAVIDPIKNFNYIQIFQLIFFIEMIRLLIVGARLKKEGVRIISVGIVLIFAFSSYDMLMDLGVINAFHGIVNGSPFGFLGLIVSVSIYLASEFAKTNERMLMNERQAKELELQQRIMAIEDERKSKELGDARKLQLSMLPQCSDKVGGFDTCFDMKPATEVGGDYYDYHISKDGTLTLAIGDATGHGMKAGIMVSIMKSLFITHVEQTDILSFLNIASRTIKQMQLGNLYMAIMIISIKERKMKVASAGMPPLCIFRSETKTVEELVIKGMPLGAYDSYPYSMVQTELAIGDTLLLMSDGLPELFNDKNETFDLSRIANAFQKVAEESPSQIVQQLFAAGDDWRNGHKQDDDITLVVLKTN